LAGEEKGEGEVNYETVFPKDASTKPPEGFLNPFGGSFLNHFFRFNYSFFKNNSTNNF